MIVTGFLFDLTRFISTQVLLEDVLPQLLASVKPRTALIAHEFLWVCHKILRLRRLLTTRFIPIAETRQALRWAAQG